MPRRRKTPAEREAAYELRLEKKRERYHREKAVKPKKRPGRPFDFRTRFSLLWLDFLGYSHKEIAERFELNPETVRRLMQRAKRKPKGGTK
jgi:transposase-like protein